MNKNVKMLLPIFIALLCIELSFSQGSTSSGQINLSSQQLSQIAGQVGQWMSQYGSQFSSTEASTRATYVSQRAQSAMLHNSQPGVSYQQGLNKFSGYSATELQTYLGFKSNTKAPTVTFTNRALSLAGGNIDWRNLGLVSPVQNQGDCGSCWAFTMVANVESYYLRLKQSVDLSEQMVIDCTGTDAGCNGGNNVDALNWFLTRGLQLQGAYPNVNIVNSNPHACSYQTGPYTYNAVHTSAAGCANIVAAIYNRPLGVAVDASNWFVYLNGIYSDPVGYVPSSGLLDHNVQMVAYYPDQYYVIKNSWGAAWGESGFIRLSPGGTSSVCTTGAAWAD